VLECQRSCFSLPDGLHYLNCASRGPLLRRAEALGIEGLRRQIAPLAVGPDEYFAQSESLREHVARLVGTEARRIAVTPSVSYGTAIALHNVRLGPRSNVVIPQGEFPSDVYAWIGACERNAARLRMVERPESNDGIGTCWTERLVEAIDRDTAVVQLSTLNWTDGVRFDVTAVAERAREVGAALVLDGTQSIGATPFDFQALAPDLLLCAGYKWLFGPYQIGFAAVGDRFIDAEPFEYHWSNREGSNDVSSTEYRRDFRDGARRFDVGEHANHVSVPMLDAGVEQVLAWGPERIGTYCAELTSRIEAALDDTDLDFARHPERAAHILGIRFPEAERLERAMRALDAHEVRVSRRGTSLRISPNVYNDEGDVEALLEGLAAGA
jgi:selenocysteine lyase/cysteine desulfurase